MQRFARANRKAGYEPVQGNQEGKLGGVPFARTDFKNGEVYEALLVKACKSQAFCFVFAGPSRDEVDKVIAATELKLDLNKTGCGATAIGARAK
jgi:hypothetical protein